MENNHPVEAEREPWETPTLEVRGNLLDITAAIESVGPNDNLFTDGPSV